MALQFHNILEFGQPRRLACWRQWRWWQAASHHGAWTERRQTKQPSTRGSKGAAPGPLPPSRILPLPAGIGKSERPEGDRARVARRGGIARFRTRWAYRAFPKPRRRERAKPANASGSPSASFRGRLSGQGARTTDTRMAFRSSDLAPARACAASAGPKRRRSPCAPRRATSRASCALPRRSRPRESGRVSRTGRRASAGVARCAAWAQRNLRRCRWR